MGVSGQHHASLLYFQERDLVPVVPYRRLGGPQGQSGQMREILLPPGFDPRTFEPVVGPYTNYTVPAHLNIAECSYSNDCIAF